MNMALTEARVRRDQALRDHRKTGPVMVVDLDAIARNFRKLSSMTKGRTAAIVKGDGYGHGMLASAKALEKVGADLFFAARLDDAFALRGQIGAATVSVLDGANANCIAETMAAGIVPVINGPDQLAAAVAEARRLGRKLPAFVHIDTAMNRLGFSETELARSTEALAQLEVKGWMTHFAAADDIDIDLCQRQAANLRRVTRTLASAPLSIANSCGVFLGEDLHGDIIRPGKSTFGINPLSGDPNPMEEPAAVWAPVVQVREVGRGAAVGYSGTWRAPDRRRIAILAIGYSAGYRRSASNRGQVAFDGHEAPVIGRVSMDLTAVDVTELPETLVHEGALAEIVGPTIKYRRLAESEGTNEHEALIALGSGCQRLHLSSQS